MANSEVSRRTLFSGERTDLTSVPQGQALGHLEILPETSQPVGKQASNTNHNEERTEGADIVNVIKSVVNKSDAHRPSLPHAGGLITVE